MSILSRSMVIIPTLNAAREWLHSVPPLLASIPAYRVLIVDSSSVDGTADLASSAGFRIHTIPRNEFNHGGTRQLAADLLPDAELLIYLTQDAVLADLNT